MLASIQIEFQLNESPHGREGVRGRLCDACLRRFRQSRLHTAHRAGRSGDRAGAPDQDHWIQRRVSRSGFAHDRRQAGHHRRLQRHQDTGAGSLARVVDSAGSRRFGGGRHAHAAAPLPSAVSVCASARGNAMVPLSYLRRPGPATGHLHRAIRIPDHRGEGPPRALRPGGLARVARMGSLPGHYERRRRSLARSGLQPVHREQPCARHGRTDSREGRAARVATYPECECQLVSPPRAAGA